MNKIVVIEEDLSEDVRKGGIFYLEMSKNHKEFFLTLPDDLSTKYHFSNIHLDKTENILLDDEKLDITHSFTSTLTKNSAYLRFNKELNSYTLTGTEIENHQEYPITAKEAFSYMDMVFLLKKYVHYGGDCTELTDVQDSHSVSTIVTDQMHGCQNMHTVPAQEQPIDIDLVIKEYVKSKPENRLLTSVQIENKIIEYAEFYNHIICKL